MKRADVIEYLELHSQSATIEKRMKELKPVLLEALAKGQACPRDLPMLLERRVSYRRISDWKEIAFGFARRLWKTPHRAELEVQKIEDAFPTKEVESLHVVANPAMTEKIA